MTIRPNILCALCVLCIVAHAQPMPPAVARVVKYRSAVVPKQATQLVARIAAVIAVPPAIQVGVSYADGLELDFATNASGPYLPVLTTNTPVFWYTLPAPGAQGFYRAKTTWGTPPVGCLVSTNAPMP